MRCGWISLMGFSVYKLGHWKSVRYVNLKEASSKTKSEVRFDEKDSVTRITGLNVYSSRLSSRRNANNKMPLPKTPMQKMLTPKPQPPNTKISGIWYIDVLSVAFRPDTERNSYPNTRICRPKCILFHSCHIGMQFPQVWEWELLCSNP